MESPLQWIRQPGRNAHHRFRMTSSRSRRPPRRLLVEGLESRCLLSVTINEFPIPTPDTRPLGITEGPDGNLWFTEANDANPRRIGEINPTTHVVNEFPIPTAFSYLTSITAGRDGNLYFTDLVANSIAAINPTTHVVTEFSLPKPNRAPFTIITGPDGNLWFTEFDDDQIGQFNPTTHALAEFPLPTASAEPKGITAGPDGNLWFTEFGGNKIGRINPTTHTIAEFPVSTANSAPDDITAGPDGNLWFTFSGSLGQIGQINPTTGTITEFPVPGSGVMAATGITAGPDGNLWFTYSGNAIGQINPTTHAIAEFPFAGAGGGGEITTGPDGNLWFTGGLYQDIIGQVVLTAPAPAPDLALSGNAPSSVTLGSNLTYNLTVTNNGTGGATGVKLIDTLPPGVTFVSATGGVTPVNGVLTFGIGTLAAGDSASFTIVVTPTAKGTLPDRASVRMDQPDPTPADDSVSRITTVTPTVVGDGPTVTAVQPLGSPGRTKALVLTFDKPLDPTRAQILGNYQITALGGPKPAIRIKAALYNATTHTVTLRLARRLKPGRRFQLTVIGTGPNGVIDLAGNLLDGQKTGVPGSNFVMIAGAGDSSGRSRPVHAWA